MLSTCEFHEETGSISLAGLKDNLEFAEKFIKFNIENLQYIDKLQETKHDMASKLNKLVSQYKSSHKVEFQVPGEIVGLLVGHQ